MMISQSRMNAKKKYQRVINVKHQLRKNLQINKIFATQIEMENKITKRMTNNVGMTINKTTNKEMIHQKENN
jgi:hypothetical protein